MPVRYSLCCSIEKLKSFTGLEMDFQFEPRYNAGISQSMPVIIKNPELKLEAMNWGLVHEWSIDAKISESNLCIKSDTAMAKSPFKQLVSKHRCLVLADGYFEWKNEKEVSSPFRIALDNQLLFGMAGIYDVWKSKTGEVLKSFALVTQPSIGAIKDFAEHMPVIIEKSDWPMWFDNSQPIRTKFLNNDHQKISHINYYKVNKIIDKSDSNSPDCIAPAPLRYPGETLNMFDNR